MIRARAARGRALLAGGAPHATRGRVGVLRRPSERRIKSCTGGVVRERRELAGRELPIATRGAEEFSPSTRTAGITSTRVREFYPAEQPPRAWNVRLSSIAFGNQTISALLSPEVSGGVYTPETLGFAPLPRGRFAFIVCNRRPGKDLCHIAGATQR